MRAALVVLCCLAGCGIRPIQQPAADQASLAAARRMDAIEALVEAGSIDEARTALDRALADGLEHPRAFMIKGRLVAHDDSDAAVAAAQPWYERAIASSPGWFEPRFALAQGYIRLGRLDSAESVIAGIERLLPEHPAGPYGRGVIARMQGDDERAGELFAQALRRDADYQPALLQAMLMARQGGDREREERHLQRLLSAHGDDPDLHRRLGELSQAEGRLADAERSYRFSYRLRPDPITARRLADLAQQQGDEAAADRWLARAEGRDPDAAQTVDSPPRSP